LRTEANVIRCKKQLNVRILNEIIKKQTIETIEASKHTKTAGMLEVCTVCLIIITTTSSSSSSSSPSSPSSCQRLTKHTVTKLFSLRRKAVVDRIKPVDAEVETLVRAVIEVILESLPDTARVIADAETVPDHLRLVGGMKVPPGLVQRGCGLSLRCPVVEYVVRLGWSRERQ